MKETDLIFSLLRAASLSAWPMQTGIPRLTGGWSPSPSSVIRCHHVMHRPGSRPLMDQDGGNYHNGPRYQSELIRQVNKHHRATLCGGKYLQYLFTANYTLFSLLCNFYTCVQKLLFSQETLQSLTFHLSKHLGCLKIHTSHSVGEFTNWKPNRTWFNH